MVFTKRGLSGIELAETTLNLPLLESVARLSGGEIFQEGKTSGDLFLRGKESRDELRETTLWDRWPVLLLMLGLLTGEWILRKRSGLA